MVEQIKFELGESNEIVLRYPGKKGARGEKRAPRKKRTAEDISRQNQRNKENNLRRKILLNFKPGDLWCTLKYPKGTRKTPEEVKADWREFAGRLRSMYKKAGHELKFIYRPEIGSRGGAHIHLLVNRIPNADLLIDEAWGHRRVFRSNVYEEGGCEALAEYIAKKDPVIERLKERKKDFERQTDGQLDMFGEDLEQVTKELADRQKLHAYGCSRNLVRPEDVKKTKTFSHWTLRALFDGDMPKASEGFIVDKDSIHYGVNPYTGLSYITYREVRAWKGSRKCRSTS